MAPLTSTGSVVAASTASTRRRGPVIMTVGGSAITRAIRMPLAKFPVTRGRTSTDARLAIIKREVKLPGYDLHHFHILRHMNLAAVQIESPLPRVDAGQIDLRPHIRSLQAMNHPLRPPYPDLRLGEAGGIDLQVVGKITELQRHLHFDFGGRIVRHHQPQADGEQQGNQLEPDILNENALQKTALAKSGHRQSSLPGPACGKCELGGSSSIKLSSTGLGSVGAGA